jgi:uncharacterized protein YjbI with pentapeptide repeats
LESGKKGGPMKLAQSVFLACCFGAFLAARAVAQEHPVETCSLPEGWKPTTEELASILAQHQQWAEQWAGPLIQRMRAGEITDEMLLGELLDKPLPKGRANLCNANLVKAKLNGANLLGAELNNANLFEADLDRAFLIKAELNRANLTGAKLNGARLDAAELNSAILEDAELNRASLGLAKLNGAYLFKAKLNKATLSYAELNKANLHFAELNEAMLVAAELDEALVYRAKLNGADLTGAKLNGARLDAAELNRAILHDAELNRASLSGAELRQAQLTHSSVGEAVLAYADLTSAMYAPASAPPHSFVAGIKGLRTVKFPAGEEVGLVQVRELLQKAGLRDLERETTYAIENGKTAHALSAWSEKPPKAAEGVVRKVAFDWTTAYGLDPGRALLLIVALWMLLIPIYWWPIWRRRTGSGTIFRIWPKDRIEVREGEPTLDNPARVEPLHARGLSSVGWSAYFSLLSAFHIGFREFSVGTWIARLQPRSFALEATGWVRALSGGQSLLSVYLLAMWVLTYFGRPFQ